MDTNLTRKHFLQGSATAVAAAIATPQSASARSTAAPTSPTSARSLGTEWDKTFPLSAGVQHRKITVRNRYGITLVADLYQPKRMAAGRKAALVVCGPFGAVKEQSSGLYAHTLAERGFVTLAFDPSFTGESGGEPRNLASPDINTEDVSAAVDAIGLLPEIDRERIGVVGICGWGGIALNAVAADLRIKAVAAITMYDMSRLMSKGYDDTVTPEQRTRTLAHLGTQRWQDAEKGSPARGPVSLELKGGEPPFIVEYAGYYKSRQRGFHQRAVNSNSAWTLTTPLSFMNAPLMSQIATIAPRPILFVHGEQAHSRYFAETAYAAASEPKQLMIIPKANHVDLYDRMDKIPFDAIARFFDQHMKHSA
jgi:uncharacterized protein